MIDRYISPHEIIIYSKFLGVLGSSLYILLKKANMYRVATIQGSLFARPPDEGIGRLRPSGSPISHR